MKPVLITSGEPAGIGPDICLALAQHQLPAVILADPKVMQERAQLLGLDVECIEYDPNNPPGLADFQANFQQTRNTCWIWPSSCAAPVKAGQFEVSNASYVLNMLNKAASSCKRGEFSALVTAPVHKGILCEAGEDFTGHTEFFARFFNIPKVVMMLACSNMRVALATTHLPLRAVSAAITPALLTEIVQQLDKSLRDDFAILKPKILVAGLNPHAGEGGHLGHEEIAVIAPTLEQLKNTGIDIEGPLSADTLFSTYNLQKADVFLVMYHDQGLPVLKYASFGQAVNITLGLPIIRTSVDHGTALDLAGTGRAQAGSLLNAVNTAIEISVLKSHDKNKLNSSC